MAKQQLETIELQGKKYVQVKTRIESLHKNFPNCKIVTEPTFNAEAKAVIFKATVTPDVKNLDRFFVGHSFGTLAGVKAMEKLESVAVGRALAFMGIGLEGGAEIASEEEMEAYTKRTGSFYGGKFHADKEPTEEQKKIADELDNIK